MLMKTMTCAQMGGSCDAKLTAASEKEMMDVGWKHIEEAHPDMAEKIKGMPKEDTETWMTGFHTKWEATPEDAMPA